MNGTNVLTNGDYEFNKLIETQESLIKYCQKEIKDKKKEIIENKKDIECIENEINIREAFLSDLRKLAA